MGWEESGSKRQTPGKPKSSVVNNYSSYASALKSPQKNSTLQRTAAGKRKARGTPSNHNSPSIQSSNTKQAARPKTNKANLKSVSASNNQKKAASQAPKKAPRQQDKDDNRGLPRTTELSGEMGSPDDWIQVGSKGKSSSSKRAGKAGVKVESMNGDGAENNVVEGSGGSGNGGSGGSGNGLEGEGEPGFEEVVRRKRKR